MRICKYTPIAATTGIYSRDEQRSAGQRKRAQIQSRDTERRYGVEVQSGATIQNKLQTKEVYILSYFIHNLISTARCSSSIQYGSIQHDLHNLERHLSILQLRKPQRQAPIISYFQPSSEVATVAAVAEVAEAARVVAVAEVAEVAEVSEVDNFVGQQGSQGSGGKVVGAVEAIAAVDRALSSVQRTSGGISRNITHVHVIPSNTLIFAYLP